MQKFGVCQSTIMVILLSQDRMTVPFAVGIVLKSPFLLRCGISLGQYLGIETWMLCHTKF